MNLPLPLLETKATLCWVGGFLLHIPVNPGLISLLTLLD